MPKLPQQPDDSATVRAIYEAYRKADKPRQSRRLGASIIGRECSRQLWYSFRHCKPVGLSFEGRMLRLFETGHLEEPRFAANLRAIGCEVHLGDDETGGQFEFTAVGGHVVDKIDGAAVGIPEAPKAWHVLEFKTHSAKSFRETQKHGVKKSKPEHYSQCVVGMGLSGMKRCLYLAKNKDTDELYSERFRWEECRADFDALIQKAEAVIGSSVPPEKISEDPDFFQCKFCDYSAACHGSTPPAAAVPVTVSCRNCVHSTAEMDGKGRWSCAKHGKTLADIEQDKACEDHLFIPALVAFADVQDAGYAESGDWTEYRNRDDGAVWRNTKSEGGYSSVELTVLPGPLVAAGVVGDAKEVFADMGAEVVGVSPSS